MACRGKNGYGSGRPLCSCVLPLSCVLLAALGSALVPNGMRRIHVAVSLELATAWPPRLRRSHHSFQNLCVWSAFGLDGRVPSMEQRMPRPPHPAKRADSSGGWPLGICDRRIGIRPALAFLRSSTPSSSVVFVECVAPSTASVISGVVALLHVEWPMVLSDFVRRFAACVPRGSLRGSFSRAG